MNGLRNAITFSEVLLGLKIAQILIPSGIRGMVLDKQVWSVGDPPCNLQDFKALLLTSAVPDTTAHLQDYIGVFTYMI